MDLGLTYHTNQNTGESSWKCHHDHLISTTPTFPKASPPPTNNSGDLLLPQPLEFANTIAAGYIATLHTELQSFLTTLAEECLLTYAVYHNNKETILNTAHKIPTSLRNVKLVLQPLPKVNESEGFKALQSKLDIEIGTFHQKLLDKYIKPLDTMNSDALLKRFHIAVCQLLRSATKGFIAQLDIRNYDADMAMVDLLALSPADLLLSHPLPEDLESLLRLYKEAHDDITILPVPTHDRDDYMIRDIINNININTNQLGRDSPASSNTWTLDSNNGKGIN